MPCVFVFQLWGGRCRAEWGGTHSFNAYRTGDFTPLCYPAHQYCRPGVPQTPGNANTHVSWPVLQESTIRSILVWLWLYISHRALKSKWRTLRGSTLSSWMSPDPHSTWKSTRTPSSSMKHVRFIYAFSCPWFPYVISLQCLFSSTHML